MLARSTMLFAAVVLAALAARPGHTQELDPEAQRLEASMNSALRSYGENLQQAVDQVAPREGDTPSHASGTGRIEWKRKSMDIPQVTISLRRRDLSFHAPQVTMRQRSISFDVPEVRMERREVGCTPRTRVEWRGSPIKRPHVTNWCQPNYIDWPETRMVTKRISTDIPEVTMALRNMAFSVPESRVSMRTISWDLPEFVAECNAINSDACEAEERRQMRRAEETEQRINEAMANSRREGAGEASRHVSAFFSYQRNALQQQHAGMAEVLTSTARQMNATLQLMQAQGMSNSPEAEEIRASLAKIQSELPAEMDKIQQMIVELSASEAEIIRGLSDGPAT